MRKLAITLTAAALALGSMALSANAQIQHPGAASLHGLAQNATPIAKEAACRGYGAHCGPGWHWRCGAWGCHCRPCW